MAVYTEVPDDELKLFIQNYGLGAVLSYKGIAEGVENTNYVVHTEKGAFILTLYEKRVEEHDLPFFLKLMEFLSENGLNCPTPLRDLEGNILNKLSGRPAALVTFLQGMWLRKPEPKHCYALGIAMANFHRKSQEFDMSRANSLSVRDWRPLFQKFESKADSIGPGISHKINAELCYLEEHWPTDLPKGIIHADLFPDNVFFLRDELSGLIDFYFSSNDLLAYDIAICLNAWCFEHDSSFNVTKAKALLKGYQSVRSLETSEVEALPILARGAAMRFLLTRSYDWLHTSADAFVAKKDPKEYLQKLFFHQHVRSSSEYGID